MRATALAAVALSPAVAAWDNGLAKTPGMGFNTWNQFGCNFNETRIRGVADAMQSMGFVDAGYKYLVMDDCWMDHNRDSNGNWQMDLKRFPSGAEALVKYVNSKGLELGVYSSAGPKTCQGLPASLGREKQDAATIAKWGVGFLKYDNCGSEGITEAEQRGRHQAMRDAIAATGKKIYYSLSEWNGHRGNPADWVRPTANSWRTGGDIAPHWDAVEYQLDSYARFSPANLSGPGGWGDPDMLEVGVYIHGDKPQFLSPVEEQSHMALWCLLKAPLMMGGDVTTMKESSKQLLLNKHAIAINQDSLGVAGQKAAAAAPPPSPTAAGERVVVTAGCSGAPAVQWQGQQLTIGGGLCLAASAGTNPSTGNPAARWVTCDAGAEQQKWTNSSKGLVNAAGGLCLEVAWAHAQPGATVELNTCSGWDSERWVVGGAGRFVSGVNSSNCLADAPAPAPGPAPSPSKGGGETWFAPLSGGGVAAVLLNRGDSATSVTVDFTSVGLDSSASVRVTDVWTQGDLGTHKGSFTAATQPHGSVFVKLTRA